MAVLRVDLDRETYMRLLDEALSERRPVPLHAAVVIRRALGLPFPYPLPGEITTGIDPAVPPDTIEFRDPDGNVVGKIVNIGGGEG